MKVIGLLAGVGRLPVDFARAASGMGFAVIAIGVVPGVDPELAQAASRYYSINAGELGRVVAALKQEGVQEVTMLGKVTKVNDSYVTVEVSELADKPVEIIMQKSSVSTVLPKGTIKAL